MVNAVDYVSAKMPKPLLEAFVTTPEQATAAVAAGADRIELCGPGDGGTTPSLEVVAETLRRVQVPVHAMLRPRSGDFHYSDAEFAVMRRDASVLREAGVAGLVFGILRPDHTLDTERMAALVALARPLRVCCHRAFDETPAPDAALDALLKLGVDLVLTSGHAPRAMDGAAEIAHHVQRADGRLTVMAGGGVRGNHVRALVAATGVTALHARGVEPRTLQEIATVLRD